MSIDEIRKLLEDAENDPYENPTLTNALRELLAYKMWAKQKEGAD